jgi:UDP-glucose 4-epimerase
MSILLTGGLGYIGSHTFVELVEKGYNVIILDNLSNSKIEQVKKLENLTKTKVKLYIGDMLNRQIIVKVFCENEITFVIHFAGLKSVNESINNPLKYYNVNLQILMNLLCVMEKNNCKNLVFSSSATVYGNNKNEIYDENSSVGQNLTNPYGKTKYFQEEMLIDLHKSDKSWNIVILRYFNPVGAHFSGEIGEEPNGVPANLFPCIIKSIKEKTQLKIYGTNYNTHDGTCIRDFIHVVDLAKAHIAVLDCKGLNIYNVGTGKKTSVLDIITSFEKINSTKLNFIFDNPRSGDAVCVCANCDKIFNELGWNAEKTVENMCEDGYKYYLKNDKFYTKDSFINNFICLMQKCNETIINIYNDDFSTFTKDDESPLTLADTKTNEIICDYLTELNKSLKMDILIISEEIKNKPYEERKKYDWCWLVDPLDGTKEFIKKNGQFTVNIGLVHNNTPVFGIVSIPVSGEIYYGAENIGSYKLIDNNLNKLQVTEQNNDPIKIIASNSHMNFETKDFLKSYENYDLINIGSSIKLLWIAENKADIYPRIGQTFEWDTCAGHAIVKYAGGKVLQYETENELIYNKENLLNPYFIVKKF